MDMVAAVRARRVSIKCSKPQTRKSAPRDRSRSASQWPATTRVSLRRMSVVRILLKVCNLLDQMNNATSNLWRLDLHEEFNEFEALRRGEKIGDVGKRRCRAFLIGRMRRSW
jgi:hypothetical protein